MAIDLVYGFVFYCFRNDSNLFFLIVYVYSLVNDDIDNAMEYEI